MFVGLCMSLHDFNGAAAISMAYVLCFVLDRTVMLWGSSFIPMKR
jgi:hypothetical protein